MTEHQITTIEHDITTIEHDITTIEHDHRTPHNFTITIIELKTRMKLKTMTEHN